MQNLTNDSPTSSLDEVYLNHEIFIQPNRDVYRGGFEWAVCLDGLELDTGLEFSVKDALKMARGAVDKLTLKAHK